VEVGELPTIEADATQMRQLFQNLVANALKFHREGVPPVVKVSAELISDEREQTLCRIRISDNGVGFDQKHAQRIFDAFQRLHGRDRYEGTGIGLAICRRIVQRHAGRIAAHGESGKGASFTVTIPAAHPGQQGSPKADESPS
jgi:signal transduction histidine kinase